MGELQIFFFICHHEMSIHQDLLLVYDTVPITPKSFTDQVITHHSILDILHDNPH
jgi:hypothetical protein